MLDYIFLVHGGFVLNYDKSNHDILKRSLEFCIISPSTSCINRGLLKKYNGFDESLICCEDYDLWLKILLEHEVCFIEDYLTKKYGGHDDQLSTSFVAMDYFKVRSLSNILLNYNPDIEKKQLIIEVLLRKSEQLLKGYIKHSNLSNYDEILALNRYWKTL